MIRALLVDDEDIARERLRQLLSSIADLEVIGEAAKTIPEAIRSQHPEVDWKKLVGLRNILIHEYFGIDAELIWDIIQNKLATLEEQIRAMLD